MLRMLVRKLYRLQYAIPGCPVEEFAVAFVDSPEPIMNLPGAIYARPIPIELAIVRWPEPLGPAPLAARYIQAEIIIVTESIDMVLRIIDNFRNKGTSSIRGYEARL